MIGIVGTGSWATALAQVLVDNNQETIMWGRSESEVDDINTNHRNSRFFDCAISEKIIATRDFSKMNDCDIVLLAVPVKAFNEILENLKETLDHPVYIINVAKGFNYGDNRRLSLVIKDTLKESCLDVISLVGPSHAEEVILRLVTTINSVCENEDSAMMIQKLFANGYFRVYRNTDVVGAEISSAVKNVLAISSGIATGIGQGDNCRAALMTRGLAEISRFGMHFGARKETFLGLNGVGDLIVTCSSVHSRNYQAGLRIGKDDDASAFLETNKMTVEGINTAKAIHEICKQEGIEMPISEEVYRILYENKKPSRALYDLMSRELKSEN